MSISVENVKELKNMLERDIENLINVFEHKTGVVVIDVSASPNYYNTIGSPPMMKIRVTIEL